MRPRHIPLGELKLKALVGLWEMAQLASHTPYPRSHALRFVLAWLFSVSSGRREPYDVFWRSAVKEDWDGNTDYIKRYLRSSALRGAAEGIAKTIGIDQQVVIDRYLATYRSPGAGELPAKR